MAVGLNIADASCGRGDNKCQNCNPCDVQARDGHSRCRDGDRDNDHNHYRGEVSGDWAVCIGKVSRHC